MTSKLLSSWQDGMSRSERRVEILMPGNMEIDGRGITDFLQFAAELSGQINFYNFDNESSGDWKNFFDSHAAIWAALNERLDSTEYSKKFEWHRSSIYYAETDEGLSEHLQQLFQVLFTMADGLLTITGKIRQQYYNDGLTSELEEITVAGNLIINKLNKWNWQAQQLLGNSLRVAGLDTSREQFAEQTASSAIFAAGGSNREKIIGAIAQMQAVFSELLVNYNRLSGVSAYYLKNHPLLKQQYPPHLALFITFLQLYDHLRQRINQLTQKHLDYYYREILSIQYHPEYPDKVHLLFEPGINTGEVMLEAGEELLAEIPGQDEALKYKLLNNIAVTKAQVEILQTLFTSEQAVFSGEAFQQALTNTRLYKNNYSCLKQDTFLKEKELIRSRALFGEDQVELPEDQRTMEDAETGLLVASPLLYLTGGKRSILLKFYFEPATYNLFDEYAKTFSQLAKKNIQAVFNEILSNAFTIDFTAADGWTAIKKYAVKAPGDNSLEVCIEMGAVEKAIGIYNAAIHGSNYETEFPVMRLLINNENPHNAYSFLRHLIIERIHIKVDVSEFSDVRMQNNIGQLSPLTPFQPFGPQPFVGSWFEIKNTNVLNRYTTKITVRIEWLELPKEHGGFKTWFAAYNAGIDNDSFKIAINSLSEGKSKPAVNEQQQENLFHTHRKNEFTQLNECTVIKDIDLKKLEYLNTPLLEAEETDTISRNGAIRFELVAPSIAFGNQLYPRIFPEIALHNSRRFVKKLPLPEQPYIPKVKRISIAYTLEYAEAFKENDGNGNIQLLHQHPFGYKKIYPGTALRNFMPRFDFPANLYIGISNIQPGSELTLLFQLEKSNFHHTLHQVKPVVWSYLVDDTWIEMPRKMVVADATHNFISSGIVKIKIPAAINTSHTICSKGLYWLRASLSEIPEVNAQVIAIYAQSVLAERIINTEIKSTGKDFYLPAGSITGFARKVPGIRNAWQLFPSFNGQPAENDDQYYTRISERLRHKQRPLTATDYEQIVLQQFPSISMVKCFGTTENKNPVYPGVNVQVIVIPKERADGGYTNQQPKADLETLFAIKRYLSAYISPFIKIEVGNPVYEKVKITGKIRFVGNHGKRSKQGDSGLYLKKFHEDVKAFFCPWLFKPGADIKIGTRIYLSGLLTYLQSRTYVEEITGFSVIHFYRQKDINTGELKAYLIDSAVVPVEYIQGSVPEAVLIPSENHLLTVIDDWEYEEPSAKGVNDFLVGDELLVAVQKHQLQESSSKQPGSSEDEDEYFDIMIPI